MRIQGDHRHDADPRRRFPPSAQGAGSTAPHSLGGGQEAGAGNPADPGSLRSAGDVYAAPASERPKLERSLLLASQQARPPAAAEVLQAVYPSPSPRITNGGALERLLALAARVTHSLLPSALFVPNLAAATAPAPPAAEVPPDLVKACGKSAERATCLAEALARVPLAAEERSQVQQGLCRLVRSSHADRYLLEALKALETLPGPAQQFESFARMVAVSSPSQAVSDLMLAQAAAARHATPPTDAASVLLTLRETDPGRKQDYPSYDDLTSSLDYVLEAGSPQERSRRLDALGQCQKGRRTPSQALPFARALDALACDDTQRSQVSDALRSMLGSYNTRSDADLVAAVRAADGKEASAAFRVFESLLDEDKNVARALGDFRLATQVATARGLETREVADHVLALRQAEPSRKNDYRSFSALEGALDLVVAGTDAATRAQSRERLIALQCGRRHTVECVLELEKTLQGLKVPDAQRDGVRVVVVRMLGHVGYRDIPTLREAVQAVDGQADAGARFTTLEQIHAMDARQVQAALKDYRLADAAAAKHDQPFASVAQRLLELRKNDPGRKADYPQMADLTAPLEQVLSHGGDQARDSLLSLQVNGRTPEQATPHAIRLQKLSCGAEERAHITEGYRKALKQFGTRQDPTLLKSLDHIEAPGAELRQRFDTWRKLLDLTRNPDQALIDLRLAIDETAATGRPFADAGAAIVTLREADPGRKADYPTFAPLASPLHHALEGTAAISRRTEDLAALQVGKRTPTEALAHDQRLLTLKCDPSTQVQVRAEYQALLRKSGRRDDVHLLALLDALAARTSPLEDLRDFRRVFDCVKRTEAALGDFTVALAASDRSGVPAGEVIDHVVALRKADPACKAEYPTFGRLAKPLDFVLQAADPAAPSSAGTRLARRQELIDFMVGGRGVDKALSHATAFRDLQIPAAQRPVVGETYRDLMARSSKEDVLLNLLSLVDHQADAEARMTEMQRLARATRNKLDVVLTDYRLCTDLASQQPSVPRAEMVEHAVKMRKDDPTRKDGYFCPLEKALPAVVGGATPEVRTERREGYLRLLHVTRDSGSASQELSWIVNTADAGEDMATRTRKMVRLHERMPYSQRERAKAVYERIQADAATEPQGWFARLLRLPRTYERITHGLLKQEKDVDRTVAYLGALERGRFQGERYQEAYARLQDMLKLGTSQQDAPMVARAFETVVASGTTLGATPEDRWNRFTGLLREVQSAGGAALVWETMAGAETADEAGARQAAFKRVQELSAGRLGDALLLYRALTEGLGPAEPVRDSLSTLEELCTKQKPDMAAATHRSLRIMRDLPADDLALLAKVYSHAASAQELELLNKTVTTPVGEETLQMRGNVLNALLTSKAGVNRGAEGFRQLGLALGPAEFPTLAPSVATLAGILQNQHAGDGVTEACHALAWAREQHFEAEPDLTLPEALNELGSNLLLGGDLETAQRQVLNLRDQRRKSRLSGGATSRVDVGQDEISVGGVRIKIRRQREE